MKINILTPYRIGGPYYWGKQLTEILIQQNIDAKHIHKLPELFISPFFQNADLVHTAVPLTYKLWNHPVILTVKGDYLSEKNLWSSFYPKAIVKAAAITTPSHFLKNTLNLQQAVVIPNAINSSKYIPVKHTNKNNINLVTITKFFFEDKARGIINILDLLQQLPKPIRSKIQYTVVGGGPFLNAVIDKAKQIDIRINFTGMLPSAKTILEQSDIFLYYSHHDNFPNVILEAMACGLPVITNDVGAVKEFVKNPYGIVSTNDQDYYLSLIDLIEDSETRINIGSQARTAIESKYDWKILIKYYLELYQQLLS